MECQPRKNADKMHIINYALLLIDGRDYGINRQDVVMNQVK